MAAPLPDNNLNSGASKVTQNPATNITGVLLDPVSNDSSRFIINLDGPVKYDVFVLTEPDKIVVELENTMGHEHIDAHSLKNDMVQLIRTEVSSENKLKIIIDLKNASFAKTKLVGVGDAGQYQLVIGTHKVPELKPEQDDPVITTDRPLSSNSNIIPLTLHYQNSPLGSIDALDYDAGYMLPLSQIFQVLGFPIKVHYDSGIAEGWFVRPTQNFIMDIPKKQIITKGKKNEFLPDLVQKRAQDIFVDISLLEKYFPVLFHIDPSSFSLTITADPSLHKSEKEELIKQWLTAGGYEIEKVAVLPLLPLEKPKIDFDKASKIFSDEDIIVLEPVIDNEPIGDFLEVYQIQDKIMVPLKILSDMLDFNISVSVETGKAKGWFINDKRTFFLDLNIRQAKKLDSALVSFADTQVFMADNEFYVDTELFSQLLPLDLKVILNKLVLEIIPREALPYQIRQKRLKNWERLQSYRRKEEAYQIIDMPYAMAGGPFVDLSLAQSSSKNKLQRNSSTSYSLLATGDVGYLNSTLFASGGDVDWLSSFRINAGKRSIDADLLGAMNATQFYVGDINSVTVPLVAQSTLGRGVSVSNREINRSSQFESTNFIGDALPDWEIELYHNGGLIDFQVVGDNARYAFWKQYNQTYLSWATRADSRRDQTIQYWKFIFERR